MGLKDDINEESKKYGANQGSNDFFQFEKGTNRMRILVQPKVIAFHFFGKGEKPDVCVGIDEGCPHHKEDSKKPSIKLATYIIDRKDGKVKLAELPLSISYSLNDLQEDEDQAFEGFPMPYDIKIISDPDNNDPKAKYRLIAGTQRVPLTEVEKTDLDNAMVKMSPEQYVETRKSKQSGVSPRKEESLDEIYPTADIPF
jgi:hypothetical protein